jgi:excisionase family DNA binding protein
VNLHELHEAERQGRMVRLDDLPEVLEASRASIYRAAARGEIPGVVSLGRLRRVNPAAVLAWLGTPAEPAGDES